MTDLREFRPGLWLTELALEAFDVRGAVIVGRERVLVWDTLSHPRDMAPVQMLLENRPPIVAYSHADWDHVWGTAGLPPAAAIVAQDACGARFAGDVPQHLARIQGDDPGPWDDVVLVPPTMTFAGRVTLDLGGVTVELHHVPGHTEDCLVAFIPAWGILLAGDTVETPFPIVNDGAALPGWVRGLEAWADDARVTTVIPCHGEIGGRELIRRNIDYLAALRRGDATGAGADTAFYADSHQANLRQARELGYTVRATTPDEQPALTRFVAEQWGSDRQVTAGELYRPADFPGFVAEAAGRFIGYAPYRMVGDTCQLLLLNALEPGRVIGRRLLDAVVGAAREAGCRRVTVVTTNDNLPALRFYQRYGFVLAGIRSNALAASRLLKPEIPLTGIDGIPLRDEIELEHLLA